MTSYRLSAFVAPAILVSALALASEARAVTFDFDVSTDYSLNFTRTFLDTGSSGAFGYNAGSQALIHTSTGSGSAVFVYDTTTANTTPSDKFTDTTVSFDFSLATAGASVGVYFGGASRTSSASAIFNLNSSGSNDIIRFFSAGSINGGTATSQFGSTVTSSTAAIPAAGGWTVGTTYKATLDIDYVTATTANVTFTISDPYTALATRLTSFSATASGITLASGGGEIAFRSGFTAGSPAGSNLIDNITIGAIPEPSSFAAFGGLAALGCAALRRRRRA